VIAGSLVAKSHKVTCLPKEICVVPFSKKNIVWCLYYTGPFFCKTFVFMHFCPKYEIYIVYHVRPFRKSYMYTLVSCQTSFGWVRIHANLFLLDNAQAHLKLWII
jgi:hypothetical protein